MWALLRHIVDGGAGAGDAGDAPAMVAFLLRLSFVPRSVPQSLPPNASHAEKRLLGDLATLGLVALFDEEDSGGEACSGGSGGGGDDAEDEDESEAEAEPDTDAAAAADALAAADTPAPKRRRVAKTPPQNGSASPGALWYFPTPLAAAVSASLASSSSSAAASSGAGGRPSGGGGTGTAGFVIVETNFKVYAYTTSRLQMAIIKVFARPDYRLPNLFVGALTRESVGAALSYGVTADQVIHYLTTHAHPHVASRPSPVPSTVADQVRLWAADAERLECFDATLYDDFPSEEAFQAALGAARGAGALLWVGAAGGRAPRAFAAKRKAMETMRAFFKAQREAGKIT